VSNPVGDRLPAACPPQEGRQGFYSHEYYEEEIKIVESVESSSAGGIK